MLPSSMNAGEFSHWRSALGLSQTGAAAALGLARRMVQLYEGGRAIPQTVALACAAVMQAKTAPAQRRRRQRRTAAASAPMVFAYADPPYLGQGMKHYGRHHGEAAHFDEAGNHRLLIERLCDEYQDGWALSASSSSLPVLLPMCPVDVRVCAWVKPFVSFKPGVGLAYAWEPLLLWRGRPRGRADATVRDWLAESITLRRGLPGAKPERFCRWLFALLNGRPGDTLTDLFPGSGAISTAWAKWSRVKSGHHYEIGGAQGVRLLLTPRVIGR
jgi:hypothetical protein